MSSYPVALHVVSGTTQPSNPNDNTLWIDSNYDVTNWNFGEELPLWPMEGEVFIKYRHTSDNHARIASGVNVFCNIGAVYQLQRHLWVRCSGGYFQNGSWSPINFKLYDSGTFHSDWPWTLNWHHLKQTPGAGGADTNTPSAVLTEYDDYLTIVSHTANGYTWSHSEFHPTSLMNISGTDNIIFDFMTNYNSSTSCKLYFSASSATNSYANCYTNAAAAYRWSPKTNLPRRTYELDVSNLVGNYYINIGHYLDQDEYYGHTFTLYGVELA